jgi:hypothetical protein
VAPKLLLESGELRLSLLLTHDGQLPLNLDERKRETPEVAISRELDILASNLEQALSTSNEVWATAADIANNDNDPAAEVEYLRWASGYKAPVKPRASTIPNSLQVITRKGTLVLEAPEIASEYVESHELRISARVVARGNALCACVDQCKYAEENLAFISRIAPKQVLRIRWPSSDDFSWKVLAGVALMLEIPLDLQGRGVISMQTLQGKAFEVTNFVNAQAIVDKFNGTVASIITARPAP